MLKLIGAVITLAGSISRTVDIVGMIVGTINNAIAAYRLRKLQKKKEKINEAETPQDIMDIVNK